MSGVRNARQASLASHCSLRSSQTLENTETKLAALAKLFDAPFGREHEARCPRQTIRCSLRSHKASIRSSLPSPNNSVLPSVAHSHHTKLAALAKQFGRERTFFVHYDWCGCSHKRQVRKIGVLEGYLVSYRGTSNCDCMTLTGEDREMERYWNWKRMQHEIMNGAHVCVVVYSCTVVRALL